MLLLCKTEDVFIPTGLITDYFIFIQFGSERKKHSFILLIEIGFKRKVKPFISNIYAVIILAILAFMLLFIFCSSARKLFSIQDLVGCITHK